MRGWSDVKRYRAKSIASITRTCGGDPVWDSKPATMIRVLPAHAGVILNFEQCQKGKLRITRTCGGDPI